MSRIAYCPACAAQASGVKTRIALEHTCGLETGAINSELRDEIHFSKKGGFFNLDRKIHCLHPEHKPPTHIHIPQGKGYRHICPQCGQVTDIIPPQVTL